MLLRDTGVINRFLLDLGVISEPLTLIRTTGGVIVGMSHILLPFMVLPLYAVMRRIDPEFSRAAANLGASPTSAFLRIFVPLSLPGVLAGLPARVRPGARLLHHAGAARRAEGPDDQPAHRPADPAAPRLGLRDGDERAAGRRSRSVILFVASRRDPAAATSSAAWSRTEPMSDSWRQPRRILMAALGALTVFYLLAPTLVIVPMSFTEARILSFPPEGFSLPVVRADAHRPAVVDRRSSTASRSRS